MVDRVFQIQEYLKPLKVKLNIPALLDGREQLTAAEVKENQTIAHVRIRRKSYSANQKIQNLEE